MLQRFKISIITWLLLSIISSYTTIDGHKHIIPQHLSLRYMQTHPNQFKQIQKNCFVPIDPASQKKNQTHDEKVNNSESNLVTYPKANIFNLETDLCDNIEHRIIIIIPSYNNKGWYKKNLDSIFCQQYKNYRIIYIDDNSPDETGKLVEEYILEKGQTSRTTLIRNEKRQGALANLYYAIHSCNDQDIIVTLDGDDWFAHDKVLKIINAVYTDPNVWLTYGQFQEYPSNQIGFCRPMTLDTINANDFRNHRPTPSHLRTFYAKLFKLIKIEDLLYEGQFFPMTWDLAMMFPMIEMAHDHFKFIPTVLYIYNNDNPINDHKVSKTLQSNLDEKIRKLPKYQPLESLF